ncbi:microfibril-associated glycoprotein 4-like isoform X2 [Toxorhynchites rutilus septentrionalis]|uniref:microfibril-associated glycoprotein 4-like isoform X2 n=1 Tax=Toxorhynchites rutilus septentrionalis TaxID=329112 RepID=UPI00247999F6|nr:microfibril-associated glycoprotein 4-like isoform X2 [Toxorhynchites rutilus septentrionalis]
MMMQKVLCFVVILSASVQCSENPGSIATAAFGYELTMSGLEAVNYNLQKLILESKLHYNSLRADIEGCQRKLENSERIMKQQAKMLGNHEIQLRKIGKTVESVEEISYIRNELDMLAINVSWLLSDTSKIYRVQQTLPTTEMMNLYILQLIANKLNTNATMPLERINLPRTCANVSERRSGVRRIHPQPGFKESFEAYCDQDYEGGGWTVIQKRFDGSVFFYRGWNEYENGFGNLNGEFWLGLKKIHELTYAKRHELHVVLEDFDGIMAVAKYNHFLVGGPEQKYALNKLGNYTGTARDSLGYAVKLKFSTLDSDNDTHKDGSCAVMYQGAWCNLNGLYVRGNISDYANMMCWKAFRGHHYGLKSSTMMIRAVV